MKNHPFRWTLFGMLFFSAIILFRIVFGLTNYFLPDTENSFFIFSIFCFIGELYATYLVYSYKKIGVFLFPIFLFIEFIYYALNGWYLIDNMVGLFWYIGFGLLSILPKWEKFN